MKLHWGNAIFLFFIVFVGLGAIFITFAMRQTNDLESENYYELGASYTTQLRINERSLPFNDSVNIYTKQDNILLTLAESIATNTDTVKIYFYNPSDKQKDFELKLPVHDTVILNKNAISNGRYKVKVNWIMSGEIHEYKQEIQIN